MLAHTNPGRRPAKAYYNADFLGSYEARVLRILAEYLEPTTRLKNLGVSGGIVFFGSARIYPSALADEEIAQLRNALDQTTPESQAHADLASRLRIAEVRRRMGRYYDDAAELARRLTEWGARYPADDGTQQFVVCTGGGPGIMEAANRGAELAGGRSIGLNISLPFEQEPNPHITPELSFDFHYFFMRKLFFMSLAQALVIFPGGFGTLDELMEALTLVQTRKVEGPFPIVMYGTDFWDEVINLPKMAELGVISPEDLGLIHFTNSVDDAFRYLTSQMEGIHGLEVPREDDPA